MIPAHVDHRARAGHQPACSAVLAAVLVWLCAALLWAPPLRAEEPAILTLEPEATDIAVGQEVTLTVRVQQVSNLYGLDLRLGFDPAVFEVVDADPAKEGIQSTPGTYPYPDLVARNEADNAAGTIWYMVTQLGARQPVSGEGTVVTIRLRSKGAGTGAITVRQADLANNEGFMIPVQTEDVAITVAAPSAAGAWPVYAAVVAVVVAGGAVALTRRRRSAPAAPSARGSGERTPSTSSPRGSGERGG